MDRGWRKIVCVAGGPSFTEEQALQIRLARKNDLCHVIVVNRGWERIPNADVLYAADPEFWDVYWLQVAKEFHGDMYTASADAARKYGLQKVRAKNHPGVEFDSSTRIVTGLHSGQQAINLAMHLGAAQIVLVGYDLIAHGLSPSYGRNWHDRYPIDHMNRPHNFQQWIADMNIVAEYLHERCIDVVNATRYTALGCFRRAPLAEALQL